MHQDAAEWFWAGLRSGVAVVKSVTAPDFEVAWTIWSEFPDDDFIAVGTSFVVWERTFDSTTTLPRYGRDRRRVFEVVR